MLGIAGGIAVFGDPLGNDAPTVAGRLVAFALVVFAVVLMPAPVRAQEAVRAEEEERQTDGGPQAADDGWPQPATGRPDQALVGEQA